VCDEDVDESFYKDFLAQKDGEREREKKKLSKENFSIK